MRVHRKRLCRDAPSRALESSAIECRLGYCEEFLRVLADLVRFNRALRRSSPASGRGALAAAVRRRPRLLAWFAERLIVPQVSAVWSADPAALWSFPVRFLAEFLANHGMLGFRDRPRWQTVVGGSQRYVEALTRRAAPRPALDAGRGGAPRRRRRDGPRARRRAERFDEVVIACHADQALALLDRPLRARARAARRVPLPAQRGDAAHRRDAAAAPARRAPGVELPSLRAPRERTTVTYYMNHLQRLDAPEDFCVTLNMADRIDPAAVIRTIDFAHPVFTAAGLAAQARWREISGVRRTRYCGAYWGWGFHEDGVVSALRAVEGL